MVNSVSANKGELKLGNIEDIKVDEKETLRMMEDFNDQVKKRVLALKKIKLSSVSTDDDFNAVMTTVSED